MIISQIVDFIIGVILALLATFLFNLAIVYQKKGTEEIGELKLSDAKSFMTLVKSKIWLLGFSLGIIGGLPYMLAQGLIGVAIVQPLQGAGILVIAFFAVRWLKEKLSVLEKIGVVLLVISPVLITLGQVSPVQVSIFDPLIIPPLIIFYAVFISFIVLTFILYKFSKKGIALIVATNAGLWFGIGAISMQLGVEGLLNPVLYSTQINWFLGIFGFLFVIAGNLFATIFVQIAYQKGKAVSVVPIINTGNLLIPIIGGVIVFGQVIGNLFFFIPGVICVFLGVTLLARIQGELQKEELIEIKSDKEEPNIE
ncbi:MAG: hypothetical protein EAX96_15670 [Candidatus Lokiarchaeota archaeon]|nr:hypothetical protein [Candidatus Lokiarchaeota archaeon]